MTMQDCDFYLLSWIWDMLYNIFYVTSSPLNFSQQGIIIESHVEV